MALGLLAALLPLVALAPAHLQGRSLQPGDSVLGGGAAERLRGVVEALEEGGALSAEQLTEAAYGLNELSLAWSARPEVQQAQATVLLDLLGVLLARDRAGLGGQGEAHLARSTERALRRELDGLRRWLAFELAPWRAGTPRRAGRRPAGCSGATTARRRAWRSWPAAATASGSCATRSWARSRGPTTRRCTSSSSTCSSRPSRARRQSPRARSSATSARCSSSA